MQLVSILNGVALVEVIGLFLASLLLNVRGFFFFFPPRQHQSLAKVHIIIPAL